MQAPVSRVILCLRWISERLLEAVRRILWLATPRNWPTTWWTFVDAFRVLWACRASMLCVGIGGGLIALTDQARDIVIAKASPDRTFFLNVVLLLWAFVSWYWARVTLHFTFAVPSLQSDPDVWWTLTPDQRTWRERVRGFYRDHVPRFIGALAILSVAVAFYQAQQAYRDAGADARADEFLSSARGFVVLAAVFYAVVWLRGWWSQLLFGHGPLENPLRYLVAERLELTEFRQFKNGFARSFLVATVIAAPILSYGFVHDPVWMSARLDGAVKAVLIGLAVMVPVVGVLVLLSARTRFPLFGMVVFWMVLSGVTCGDNHHVRTLAGTSGDRRVFVADVFEQWWEVNAAPEVSTPYSIGPSPVQAPPLVVVATAGGASRAAYWTSQVLGEIAAREPRFADRLFMISGVSGGSLGATAFRAVVELDRRANTGGSAQLPHAPKFAADFITQDFLGPALATGLYVDLPLHAFPWLRVDDRAAALEKAWEAAWMRTLGSQGQHGFSWQAGFVATFTRPIEDKAYRPWPILALNGSSVEKGKRIVTSNVRFHTPGPPSRQNLSGQINRYDTFDILKRDISISTAVTMSARFPVVSPTGALRGPDSVVRTRVTDGGLYENFGAATADEVLRYIVERRFTASSLARDTPRPVWPVVILISSDPSLDRLEVQTSTSMPNISDCAPTESDRKPRPQRQPGNDWYECPVDGHQTAAALLDPAQSLYTGRTARGEAAATSLLDRVFENRVPLRDRIMRDVGDAGGDVEGARLRLATHETPDFFHFRQCRVSGRKGPTMSWHDSAEAWEAMNAMKGLTTAGDDPCGNRAEFVRLCTRLAMLADAVLKDVAVAACSKKWSPAAPPPQPPASSSTR